MSKYKKRSVIYKDEIFSVLVFMSLVSDLATEGKLDPATTRLVNRCFELTGGRIPLENRWTVGGKKANELLRWR